MVSSKYKASSLVQDKHHKFELILQKLIISPLPKFASKTAFDQLRKYSMPYNISNLSLKYLHYSLGYWWKPLLAEVSF